MRYYLPQEVLSLTELDTAKIWKDTFVDEMSADALTDIVKDALASKQGDLIMTLAEKLRQEGFEKGYQQGKAIARVTTLLFKYISDPQVLDKLTSVLSLMVDSSEKQTVLQYLDQVDLVMALAEKLHKKRFEEGYQQGLIEGLELAVSIKFTPDPFKIVPLIYQIKDTYLLKAIKVAVVTAKTADELIDMIKSLV